VRDIFAETMTQQPTMSAVPQMNKPRATMDMPANIQPKMQPRGVPNILPSQPGIRPASSVSTQTAGAQTEVAANAAGQKGVAKARTKLATTRKMQPTMVTNSNQVNVGQKTDASNQTAKMQQQGGMPTVSLGQNK